MPHSSGGGSHGGGSHGGSHGSSGNRVSSHYFAGSRRFVKHHHSTGVDEYVYASSKPSKTTAGGIVVLAVMAFVFITASTAGIISSIPRRLNKKYTDKPAIYDNIGVIADEAQLLEKLDEYQELTGICTAIYTVYDETWNDEHPSLQSYAYDKYVDEFSDEQHFVIVYSIPVRQAAGVLDGWISVPDYSWEAIQGDETDPIITEEMFGDFADVVQEELETGLGPGRAFTDAFKYALKNAHKKLDAGSASRYFQIAGSVIPVFIVAGIFIPLLIVTVKAYKRDKDIEYEEVPLDADDIKKSAGLEGYMRQTSAGGYTTVVNGNGSYSREFNYDPKDSSSLDPRVISSAQGNYEEDDDDFKRRKRQGYE